MRRVVVLAAIAVVAVAFLWPRGSAVPPRTVGEASPGAAPPASTSDPALDRARERALQAKAALELQPAPRRIMPSSLDRRPGEPEVMWKERTRALAEFQHFAQSAHLTAEEQQEMMRAFADAQDTWRLGLERLGRPQPEAPGSEMADPTLTALFQPINEEAVRRARAAIDPARASLFQSFVPTVLPYVRTQAFEVAR